MKDKSRTIAHFCPFTLIKKYIFIRGDYSTVEEPFFTLQGAMGIEQHLVRSTLTKLIGRIGLNPKFYSFQSMCAGRATDLHNLGFSIDEIKVISRWKSNTVYKYLKF